MSAGIFAVCDSCPVTYGLEQNGYNPKTDLCRSTLVSLDRSCNSRGWASIAATHGS